MLTGFEEINTKIYTSAAKKYLPSKIKILFVAESPPAYINSNSPRYFYFDNNDKAGSLFYTLIKATLNIDFHIKDYKRTNILKEFCDNGYFLIDTVDYPINKTSKGDDIKNPQREEIIANNKENFLKKINSLKECNKINKSTKCILIKETVYNQYNDFKKLNILNLSKINFPRYIKDRDVINDIKNLINR